MSLDPAGRAPRASRFTTIKEALKQQARDLARARRRRVALHKEPGFRGSERAVILMLRQLLDCAEPIALNTSRRAVHLMMTVPDDLLDAAFSLAGFEEDQDTGDDEPSGNEKESADDEASIAVPDALTNQTHPAYSEMSYWGGADRELDTADNEPSLGSSDNIDQTKWAAGDRLDRERGAGGADCDDDEENGDREPGQDDEPNDRDWPMHGSPQADWAYQATRTAPAPVKPTLPHLAPLTADEPPVIFLPTGNRPGGLIEMKNQTTGETGVWRLIHEAGKVVRS